MTTPPNSKLTLLRPDLWERALLLSTKLTAYQYVPKIPDEQTGTIYACGGGFNTTPEQRIRDKYREYEQQERRRQIREQAIEDVRKDKADISNHNNEIAELEIEEDTERRQGHVDQANILRRKIGDLRQEIRKKTLRIGENQKWVGGTLLVPEGAMEWLLHEVGHWVAATEEERALPDFGFGVLREGVCTCTNNFAECRCGDEREWQAWAFEEIILAPFGNSRNFCPPPHRGGIAFDKNQPIPDDALRHIEARLRADSISVDQWRGVYGEWVQWGRSLGPKAPWLWESCI